MKKTKLWKYIEVHMLAAGLSRNRLALMSGVTGNALYRVSYNRVIPLDSTLEGICRVLGLDIAELIRLRNDLGLYRDRAENIGAAVRGRKLKVATVICKKCGEPGEAKNPSWVKYPHEECKKAAHRERTTGLPVVLNDIVQNEIILANEELEEVRDCLKCGDTFTSEGPWNRVCDPCNAINSYNGQSARVYKIMEPGKLAV